MQQRRKIYTQNTHRCIQTHNSHIFSAATRDSDSEKSWVPDVGKGVKDVGKGIEDAGRSLIGGLSSVGLKF